MNKNKPDYYNDLDKVYLKIWKLLILGLQNRDLPFHLPVFICGDKNNSPLPITQIVDSYYEEIQKMGGNRWDTSSLIRRFRKK